MVLTSGSSKHGLRTRSSYWQKNKVSSEAEAIPSWVLDASIRLPIHFRRISSFFGSVKNAGALLLDQVTVQAVAMAGDERCNELLGLLIDQCETVRMTAAGALMVMCWVSLRLLKRLVELSAVTAFTPGLILAAARNTSHGLDLMGYFVEDVKVFMNDDLIHNILVQAMGSIQASYERRSQDKTLEAENLYECKLSEKILGWFPKAELSADIVREALEAERRSTGYDGRQKIAAPPLKIFLDRCSEPQNTENLLDIALDGCSMTSIELLLDYWPEQPVTKSMIMNLFKRATGRGRLSPSSQQILNLLISKGKEFRVDETVVANLLDTGYGEGPQALAWLRTINQNLPISQLATRIAESTFSPQELHDGFREDDFILNDTSLLAAKSTDKFKTRGKSPVVLEKLLAKAPSTAVSTKVVLAAAHSMTYRVFAKVLSHNEAAQIDGLIFIAVMCSVHPALKKIRLLLNRNLSYEVCLDASFWVSLISTNHKDLVPVLDLLTSSLKPKTTNSMMAAASRTEHAIQVLRILSTDSTFAITRQTISAILREGRRQYSAFKFLLRRAKGVRVSGSLIAESFEDLQCCRLLLKKHGKPSQLFVSESKLLSLFDDIHNSRYGNYSDREKSMRYYVQLGGRLGVTHRVLQKAIDLREYEFKFVWFLWQNQHTVSLPAVIRMGIESTSVGWRSVSETALELLMSSGPQKFDATIIDAFEIDDPVLEAGINHHSNFYDTMLQYLYHGDFSRFEEVLDRLIDKSISPLALERLFASLVSAPPEDVEVGKLLEYLVSKFDTVVLGNAFFACLRDHPSLLAAGDERSVIHLWTALIKSNIAMDWSVSAQAQVFAKTSIATVVRIMTAIGDQFHPCEEIAIAAIGSADALLKLEFIWQRKQDLEVTEAMLEGAIRSSLVDSLDFLVGRSKPLRITEDLLEIALHGVVPGTNPSSEYSGQDNSRGDMVSYLMGQTADLDISQSTVEKAIRNIEQSVAQDLITCRQNNYLGKGAMIAMLEKNWEAESIYYSLRKVSDRLELLEDPEILSKAAQTEEGRSFLRLAKSNDSYTTSLIDESIFAEAAMKSRTRNWLLLDQLHRADEIHLDDAAMTHLWTECTQYVFSTKQILFHILEQGVHARMGPKMFEKIWSTCYTDAFANDFRRRGVRRVVERLPDLPVDVDFKLVQIAQTEHFGRMSFDIILGPDYNAVIYESALVAAARLGEELWFQRLLALAEKQGLVITDKAALVCAARVGAVESVVGTCKQLREDVSISLCTAPRKSERRLRKDVLHRTHYFVRQWRRWSRPRYAKPLQRGFRRFLHDLKTVRYLRSWASGRPREGESGNHISS
jgi:hypothetical protein